MDWRKAFADPPSEFRGAPFWSWNDRLDEAELREQIRDFARVGLGGFFMHSRVGLITPYLGEEWMGCIRASVDEAKEVGLLAWLYDEDRWPSGFAGGFVTERRPELRQRALELVEGEPDLADGDEVVLRFDADLDGGKLRSFAASAAGRWSLVKRMMRNSPRFNNEAYIDTMDPEAVAEFLRSTYDAYAAVLGDDLGAGKVVPGIFTDEPSFCPRQVTDRPALPWTDRLPQEFEKRKGYDLLPKLPLLFWDGDGAEQVRFDFWDVATDLFLEAYCRQLYEWCERHGCILTGHYLQEDTLTTQTLCNGAVMPTYIYEQYPGIDHLRRDIHLLVTCKQVSSAAEQLGRERVLSELYGISGHNMSFEDQKWIGDWEYVLGVNYRCQHLAWYSMRGCRKHDYPPCISYQQPWWDDYRLVEDYFGRLSFMLTRGRRVVDLLVLHPVSSAWVELTALDYSRSDERSRQFARVSTWLTELHRDYHYGDDRIIERFGSVGDGRFKVGEYAYRAVLLPPMRNITRSTLSRLLEFLDSGGKAVAVGELPALASGTPDEALERLAAHPNLTLVPLEKAAVEAALERALPRRLSVTGPDGEAAEVYAMERSADGKGIFFFVNISRKGAWDVELSLPVAGRVEEWNPETGEVTERPALVEGGRTRLRHRFEPAGSLLLVVHPGEKSEALEPLPRTRKVAATLGGPWRIRRSAPNALVLDFCTYRIEDGEESEVVPVWKAQRRIRQHYGLDDIADNGGVMFWKSYPQAAPIPGARIALRMRFHSEVEGLPRGAAAVALETPERFKVALNGEPLEPEPGRWLYDKAIGLLPCGDALRKGENELVVVADPYATDVELEPAFIVGDFRVALKGGRWTLVPDGEVLESGDWVAQGYPFYAGSITYGAEVELEGVPAGGRLVLELPGVAACLAKVRVNGKACGARAWSPWRFDCTGAVRPGRNRVEIELVNTLRNLLGPHHHKAGELFAVGPESFIDEANWTDGYSFVAHGIMAPPKLVIEA